MVYSELHGQEVVYIHACACVCVFVLCLHTVCTQVVPSIQLYLYSLHAVNVLITDALVCAKEFGVKMLRIFQHAVKPDVLLFLSFRYEGESLCILIYNYKYHEVPTTKFWYL